jgi:hypothetical protein
VQPLVCRTSMMEVVRDVMMTDPECGEDELYDEERSAEESAR